MYVNGLRERRISRTRCVYIIELIRYKGNDYDSPP